jgi:hypothetical protein
MKISSKKDNFVSLSKPCINEKIFRERKTSFYEKEWQDNVV